MGDFKYGLSNGQVVCAEEVLSNDENGTDAEILAYLVSQGISREQAKGVLSHRQDYLINIYFTGKGPLQV